MLCVPCWLLLWGRGRLDSVEAAVVGRVFVGAAGGVWGVPRGRREQQQLLPLQVEPGRADEGPAVAQGAGAGGHRAGHGGRWGRDRGGGAAARQQREVIWRWEEGRDDNIVSARSAYRSAYSDLLLSRLPTEGERPRLGLDCWAQGPLREEAPRPQRCPLCPSPISVQSLCYLPQLRTRHGEKETLETWAQLTWALLISKCHLHMSPL